MINELQTYLDETSDEDLPNERLVVIGNALERLADERRVSPMQLAALLVQETAARLGQ